MGGSFAATDFRESVTDRAGKRLELSAFLVIVWYTYRNKSTLKFSALIRTMITEATIYFLAMVALQTSVQISLSLTNVYPLSDLSPFRKS